MATIQEYLSNKYPTKKDREQVTEINELHVNKNYLESSITKLILGNKPKLTYLGCYDNQLTTLDLSQCFKLAELNCSDNLLTSIDFLKTLPHPEKLRELRLSNNNIEKTTLEFLRPFVNLFTPALTLGNNKSERYEKGIYNRFYGSLEPLRNMTKLRGLNIEGTDIEEGLEYLPITIGEPLKCSPKLPNQKVAKIQNELKPFKFKKPETLIYYLIENENTKTIKITGLETQIETLEEELDTERDHSQDIDR
ncbi:10721_t:CDS:2 [Entrophospora sp. SA101]|nr:10721_t:CDS:2 [Entrophospora sp. SA101]